MNILYFINPKNLIILLMQKNIIKISDEKFLKLLYKMKFKKELDLNNPKTFNEKIQWLKLYDRKDKYTIMSDKHAAKEYVSKIIGKEYIIPTIGVWEKFEDIDFSKLPEEFVLKCTHDSGTVIICKDKSKLNLKKIRKKINKNLKRKYYYTGREWPYKNIKPKIIIEKYLKDSKEPKDYKFMCFNGKVKCSFVCSNRRGKDGLKVDFYDLQWNKMPFERHYPNSKEDIKKPKNFNLMIKLAEKLSFGIPFLRVDFYEINGRVYFGELTFFPGSGFEEFTPAKYDRILGDMLELPSKKIIRK